MSNKSSKSSKQQAIDTIKRLATEKGILFDEDHIICTDIDGKGIVFLSKFLDAPCNFQRTRWPDDPKGVFLFTWIDSPQLEKFDAHQFSITGSWEIPACGIFCLDWELFLIYENDQWQSPKARFPDPASGVLIVPPWKVIIKQEAVDRNED